MALRHKLALLIAIAAACPIFALGQDRSVETPPATIWNSGSYTFTRGTTGTQDCIVPSTCLARITVLYNSVTGTVSGRQPCPGYQGPTNTEWAYGDISNWATLTYKKLFDLNECSPPGMVGRPMVLHLISDNIYIQLTFNYWFSADSGFSYTRTTGPQTTATVSGRVLGPDGRGVKKALVTLKDQNNVTRSVEADMLGRYQFTGVPANASYTIGVVARRFVFTPRSLNVTGNLTNENLVCQYR